MAPPALKLNSRLSQVDYDREAVNQLSYANHHIGGNQTFVRAIPIDGKDLVLELGCGAAIHAKLISEALDTGMQQVYMVDKSAAELGEAKNFTDPDDELDASHFSICDLSNYDAVLALSKKLPKFQVIIFSRLLNHFAINSRPGFIAMIADLLLEVGGHVAFDLAFQAPAHSVEDPTTTVECSGWYREHAYTQLKPSDITMSFAPFYGNIYPLVGPVERRIFDKEIVALAHRVSLGLIVAPDLDMHQNHNPILYDKIVNKADEAANKEKADAKANKRQEKLLKKVVYIDLKRRDCMVQAEARCVAGNNKRPLGWIHHTGPFAKVVVLKKPIGYRSPF